MEEGGVRTWIGMDNEKRQFIFLKNKINKKEQITDKKKPKEKKQKLVCKEIN